MRLFPEEPTWDFLPVQDFKNIIPTNGPMGHTRFGIPAMEKTRLNLRLASAEEPTDLTGRTFLADTNYFSEDNLEYLAGEDIDAVIPDQQFRKRDPRFATQARHKPERTQFTKKTSPTITSIIAVSVRPGRRCTSVANEG